MKRFSTNNMPATGTKGIYPIPELDFKSIFETVPGLYLILDPNLTIVAVSESYLQATMTERAAILGRGLFDVFPDNPDDPGATGVSNLQASLTIVLEKGIAHTMAVQKYDIRRQDGTFEERFWSPLNKPVFNEEGRVLYIIHQVEDVTAFIQLKNEEVKRKKLTDKMKERIEEMETEIYQSAQEIEEGKKRLHAEANYREIFEKASDAIYVHEIGTGKVLEVNQRAAEITGYTKEELLCTPPQEFITNHPDYTLQHAFNYLQQAGEGKPQLFEWLSKNKDGSYNWLEVNLKKATIAGEERILAFFREINDRKKAQLEIQQLNEELEQKIAIRTAALMLANNELESFTYSVSHDLRAPLRIIDGYSDILITDYKDKIDEEGNRVLSIVKSNAQRMGQLIDDLLNLSQIGRKELTMHPTDMNKLVESVINDQFSFSGSNASIKAGHLHPASCDSSLVRQVWINLISNAVKYSSKQSQPTIELNSLQKENDIIYSVKDNGVGFDMKYAGKLFGVFQRLHKVTEFEGTGIGLALVNRILVKHKGQIWAESEPGKGATFFFSLPTSPLP